jgi:hypothetical protein
MSERLEIHTRGTPCSAPLVPVTRSAPHGAPRCMYTTSVAPNGAPHVTITSGTLVMAHPWCATTGSEIGCATGSCFSSNGFRAK